MEETTPGGGATPHKSVAPGTPAAELERLALQEATHPDATPLVIQALIWLLRASSAALADQADELRAVDLSPSGFNVLQALRNTPGRELEPCELAERLLLSRPSVTGLLDTLERKGLVERRRHPLDRRRLLIGLTEDAVALLEAHYPEHYARQNAVFAALSDDELASLVTLLRKVEGATPPHLADDA